MTPYPKHYLAEVPHELRMRVLDLCIHRQWHDALDLLTQNGFTQYEWYELVWFHDHAPTNLEPVPCAVPSAPSHTPSASDCGTPLPPSSPNAEISSAKSEITPCPDSPEAPPNPELLSLTPAAPEQIVNRKSQIVNRRRRRPRSKACRLPADVQLSLNTMLARGCRYRDIIRTLNERGYPGFNKVNLNAWKRTGFQNWLRTQPDQPFSVTDPAVLVTVSNR